MQTKQRIALVTGANRGIGYEVSRELGALNYKVILTARNEEKGRAAALRAGKNCTFIPLDVAYAESIQSAYRIIEKEFGRLDVLINNAGVYLDSGTGRVGFPSAFDSDPEIIVETFKTNTLGSFLMCKTFIPLMMKNKYGRVVNVSSGMGQLSEMNGRSSGYRISKTALNAVTKIFADETLDQGILVNSVCPGWVKTDMGGPDAERSVMKGAETILWLATLPEDSQNTSGFYRDKERIDW